MANYPFPDYYSCCCDEEPDPCECEDGVPAGILIEFGDLLQISIPFEEGVTEYGDFVTETLPYTDTFNHIDYFSKKCTDFQKKLIDSEPFPYRSEVGKWLQWIYLHLVEKVTLQYAFKIDPENCRVYDMYFGVQFKSEIYSKPDAYRLDLCNSPSGVIHSVMTQTVYDYAELQTNCSFFFMNDDPYWYACDWSLERDDVNVEDVGYTFPCTVDGVEENYVEYPEPDYGADEELARFFTHDAVSRTPDDISDWCAVEENILLQEELTGLQNYPGGWGKGYIWECVADTGVSTPACVIFTGPPVGTACELAYTPTLPDYEGTELKVSLYYAP